MRPVIKREFKEVFDEIDELRRRLLSVSGSIDRRIYVLSGSVNSAIVHNTGSGGSGSFDPTSLSGSIDSAIRVLSGTINGAFQAGAVGAHSLTNAKWAQVASGTIKGRATAGTGDVEDMTGVTAATILPTFGSTTKGQVPPPLSLNNYFLRDDGTWQASNGSAVPFGTGIDGDAVISTHTTASRAMYYNSLTVMSGIVYVTRTFPVYVKGTLLNLGTIHANGSSAFSGTNAGGTPTSTGEFDSLAGGGGGGASSNGSAGTSKPNQPAPLPLSGSSSCTGGTGGSNLGGSFTGGTGGNLGTQNTSATAGNIWSYPQMLYGAYPLSLTTKLPGGSGGGGGGGASTGTGGGGGAGGGVLGVFANTILNSGTISADGGNGGIGGGNGQGGGGGGGGGGKVFCVYRLFTGNQPTANGGVGGQPLGGGAVGADGGPGTVVMLQI